MDVCTKDDECAPESPRQRVLASKVLPWHHGLSGGSSYIWTRTSPHSVFLLFAPITQHSHSSLVYIKCTEFVLRRSATFAAISQPFKNQSGVGSRLTRRGLKMGKVKCNPIPDQVPGLKRNSRASLMNESTWPVLRFLCSEEGRRRGEAAFSSAFRFRSTPLSLPATAGPRSLRNSPQKDREIVSANSVSSGVRE